MTQLTESDKLLVSFEAKNQSLESFVLVTSEGVPFKYSGLKDEEATKLAGLMYDLMHFSKRTLEDFKKGNLGNICIRLRLTDGHEYIVKQEQDFFLVTVQLCKQSSNEDEPAIKA